MFCSKCGTRAAEGAVFCQKCGARLLANDALPPPTLSAANEKAVHLQPISSAASEEAAHLQPIPSAASDKTADVQLDGPAVTFTDQEGACADIIIRCKACGAPLEDGSGACKICGRVFVPASGQNTAAEKADIKDLFDSKLYAELLDKFKKKPAAVKAVTILGALFAAGLVILIFAVLLRLVFSSPALLIAAAAGGYYAYYRWGARYITEHKYRKRVRELQLPDGMSAQTLLESLSAKFNYPYFKGVRYGENGECVIDGRYSAYTIIFYDNNKASLSAALNVEDNMKRTIMLEGIAICNYINKFFNPSAHFDVVKDVKALKSAERQRKTVGIIITAATILVVAVFALEYALPGSVQRIAKPGIEVRGAYLTQYSETVTIEDAFKDFFENGKWSTYEAGGYSFVVFTGACEYFGERADVRLTFKITGEQFRVDGLDINGQTQSDIMMYALLSKVFEKH